MNKRKIPAFWNILGILCLGFVGSVYSSPSPAGASSQPNALIACAAPSDACWESGFHLPGVIGTVYAVVQASNGFIYAGGEIISAGGMPVNNLAMWDGATWRDLGGGVTHTNTSWQKVYALAVDASNNLYVGGTFDQAGSIPASNLAKWTGSNWEAIGGTDGTVMVIEAVSGGIYVGGLFSHAGAATANSIAYRDFQSATWLALGSGVDDAVYAIEFEPASNSLFVGGSFTSAGGVQAYGIARYTDSGVWRAVGSGLNGGGWVNALLRVARDGGGYYLYAGGAFPQVGTNDAARNIARWDGATWFALNDGTGGEVKALLQTAAGDLIVAGDFSSVGPAAGVAVNNIARWSAGAWSALDGGVGTEPYNEVNALVLSGSSIIAGGHFILAGSQVVNNLARWNSGWASLDGGLGVNNVVDVLLADESSVFVSGNITNFGSLQASGLAKLSASAWSGEGSPASRYIRALVKFGSTTLYAGGAFSKAAGANADHLASWNGVAWQELAGGTNGNVNALALASGGKLYVGGEFTDAGDGNPVNHIAMWDGAWHSLAEGLDGTVRALVVDSSGNLYAAGEFNYAGSLYVNHIAMWDGSTWHALGAGLDSRYIETLVFDSDNRLVAGGYFAHAGNALANGVAMWNGYEWSALGSGMNDGVGALAVDASGYVYAGGDFDQSGGVTTNHIARWDGFAWSALGSGASSSVFELAITAPEGLYAGGAFKTAGGKPASYIAAYTLPPPVSAPAPLLASLGTYKVPQGGAGFWLAAGGSNFSSRSVVRWNGDTLATTYVNSSQLRAFVPAARTAGPGTAAVTVFTPAPLGGGSSNTLVVEIVEDYDIFLPCIRH